MNARKERLIFKRNVDCSNDALSLYSVFRERGIWITKILVNLINLSTFSGFMFCFGYTNQIAYYRKEWKNSFGKMLKNVCRMLIAFYISGIAYVALVEERYFVGNL